MSPEASDPDVEYRQQVYEVSQELLRRHPFMDATAAMAEAEAIVGHEDLDDLNIPDTPEPFESDGEH